MVILLPVFMAEFSLFCRSLSRFIFSILKTKDSNEAHVCNQCFSTPEAEGGSSPVSRSQKCLGLVGTSLPSAASPLPLLEASGLPSSHLRSPGPCEPTCCPGASVPESLKLSIFFGWLLGHLTGLGNHVSNFLQAFCQIAELISAALGGKYQLSCLVDLIFMLPRMKMRKTGKAHEPMPTPGTPRARKRVGTMRAIFWRTGSAIQSALAK